jgi:hypothetical protein
VFFSCAASTGTQYCSKALSAIICLKESPLPAIIDFYAVQKTLIFLKKNINFKNPMLWRYDLLGSTGINT